MPKKDIIVIGASSGGMQAIKTIIEALPSDLPVSIFIVWHMSKDVGGFLPQILNNKGALAAAHGTDGEIIQKGRIYVAPPDHHLMIQNDRVRITKGPKENRFRPAIDPLFRSAAYYYGSRVIGVILSGALDDGTAGLWTVKQWGGMAIVQDPSDADVPSMPENAIKSVDIDYILPVSEIASRLISLSKESIDSKAVKKEDQERTETELQVALEEKIPAGDVFDLGKLSPFTCPECHGVLTAFAEGGRMRFRCHTGHAFSAESLLAGITHVIEENLWSTVRNIQESVMLLNRLGDQFAEENMPKLAARYFKKAQEAEQRMEQVRKVAMNHEQLSVGGISKASETNMNDL